MGIFQEINESVTNEEAKTIVVENIDDLRPVDIKKIVDYVVKELADGNKEDAGELIGQALENMAGMEGANEATIKHIATSVKTKQKMEKRKAIPKANKNTKEFKDLMSG